MGWGVPGTPCLAQSVRAVPLLTFVLSPHTALSRGQFGDFCWVGPTKQKLSGLDSFCS